MQLHGATGMHQIHKKHLGGRNELVACAWLLDNGFEVFRNVSQHGVIDLIALRGGKSYFFDVKVGRRYPSGELATSLLKPTQIGKEIKILYVFANGECVIDWNPLAERLVHSERACSNCQTNFVPKKRGTRFCSRECISAEYYRTKKMNLEVLECTEQ
jgi:Holliday junction resolvase-like predicted endonuclease